MNNPVRGLTADQVTKLRAIVLAVGAKRTYVFESELGDSYAQVDDWQQIVCTRDEDMAFVSAGFILRDGKVRFITSKAIEAFQ